MIGLMNEKREAQSLRITHGVNGAREYGGKNRDRKERKKARGKQRQKVGKSQVSGHQKGQ